MNRVISIKRRQNDLLLYFFVACMVLPKAIGCSSALMFYVVCALFAGGAAFIRILRTKWNHREMVIILLFIILAGISFYHSRQPGLFLCFLTLFCLKDSEPREILSLVAVLWDMGMFLTVLSSLSGVIPNTILRQEEFFGVAFNRYSCGFPSPNVFAESFFIACIVTLYAVQGKKIAWKVYIVLWACNVIVFFLSLSESGIIMSSLSLILFPIFENAQKTGKLQKVCSAGSCAIAGTVFFLSFLLPLIYDYDNPKWRRIDIFCSGRLRWGAQVIQNNIPPVWGGKVQPLLPIAGTTVDNAFIFALYTYGIVAFLLIVFLYIALIFSLYRRNEPVALGIVSLYIVYGFSERYFVNSFMNYSWFFISEILWYSKLKREESGQMEGIL